MRRFAAAIAPVTLVPAVAFAIAGFLDDPRGATIIAEFPIRIAQEARNVRTPAGSTPGRQLLLVPTRAPGSPGRVG